jgi:trans-2,3-dihydro-3-hydroxyanthranilate isomerase
MELPIDEIAACAELSVNDVITAVHKPVQASVGVKFVLTQVAPEALDRATPGVAAFRKLVRLHGDLAGRLSLFLYVRDGGSIRARMLAPLAGTWEGPATGSASAALGALLLSLHGGNTATFTIKQGVEMGRPSLLKVMSRRAEDGYRSHVGGNCTLMLRGEALL